jgi:Tfp pilus assembly protein PilN
MIQLNLLPDIKKEFINAQKTRALVMSASIVVTLVAVGLSVLFFVYVTFLQQLQITLATNDIKSKEQQLSNVQDLSKYLTIQNQLAALPDLHAGKGVYSRLLNFLPVLSPNSPSNISLTRLQLAGADEQITFTGMTGSFESLNVFVDTLQNAQATYKDSDSQQQTTKMFKSVIVQNSAIDKSNGKSGVVFTVLAGYVDAVFDAHNTDMTASVPNIKTSQSVTGSPKLFNGGGQ